MSEANLFENGEKPAPKRKGKPAKKAQENLPAVQQPASLAETIAALPRTADTVVLIARQEFQDAMVAMDDDLPRINRDGKIVLKGGGILRFASFENINKVVKPILRKHGFRMSYEPDVPASGQGIIVHCHLTRGLYRESCTVPVPSSSVSPAMNAQQAVGAAISYAKRYGTIALLNLETEAPEDRDTDATPEAKPINGSQAKRLLKAIEDNGVPVGLFIDKYKVTAVHELPANLFDEAMAACETYGKRAKK